MLKLIITLLFLLVFPPIISEARSEESLQKQIDLLNHKVRVLEHTLGISTPLSPEKIKSPEESNFLEDFTFSSESNEESVPNEGEISEKIYEEAFSLLQRGEAMEAAHKFSEFTEKFPTNKLTSSSYYWLGEIYRRDQNYDVAYKNFLAGYRANPKDSKAPLHLVRLAGCLHAIGRDRIACKVINKALFLYKSMPINVQKEAFQLKNSLLACQ